MTLKLQIPIGKTTWVSSESSVIGREPTRIDNYRSGQRRDHGPAEAERLWRQGLGVLGVKEEELLSAKSTRMEKQALAWLMKKHTSVTGKWIAERTRMGHLSTASVAINRFARDKSREAIRIRKELLEKLIES